MKTYKERVSEITQKAEKIKKRRKRIFWTAFSSCAFALLLAFNLVLFVPYSTTPPSVDEYKGSEYYHVIQRLNVINYEPPAYKNNYEKWTAQISKRGETEYVAVNDSATATPPTGSSSANGYVETTDNQVEGVIEGDLIKRTDEHIFYLAKESKGITIRVYPILEDFGVAVPTGHAAIESKTIAMPTGVNLGQSGEMYLSQDGQTLFVVLGCIKHSRGTPRESYTAVISYRFENEELTETERSYFSGSYCSSRMIDDKLLLVTSFTAKDDPDFDSPNQYIPRYGKWGSMECISGKDIVCTSYTETSTYAVVSVMDETLEEVDSVALLSYSTEIYVSQENLFVTHAYTAKEIVGNSIVNLAKTDIACLTYADGGLQYKDSVTVNGWVKDQYSMDEYEGILRVATSTRKNGVKESADLYCVSLSDFEIVASVIGFAPKGEEVTSARFDKEKAYVCTALIIEFSDPVYAFDLSDLQNITYVDTGTIEGYSTSLVDFTDGYLLGIGYGDDNSTLKIEIYEETESDLAGVCMAEASGSFSEEYKSYFIDREKGLLGLGICTYDRGWKDFYLLYQFNGEELDLLLCVELAGTQEYNRAVLIDGNFYMFSEEKCYVVWLGL